MWTAFINYRVASRRWIQRIEPQKISLGDLPRYIFLDSYNAELGPNGEADLYFEDEKGIAFVIDDIVKS